MLAAAVLILDLAVFALAWLAGPAGLAACIALPIGLTFLASAFHGSPRPDALRLRSAARLALWLGELAACASVFILAMPFERWAMSRDVAGTRAGALPVLLVHGYVNNAGALWRLWRTLVHKGFSVHTLNLEPVYASIDAYAPLLAARIAQVLASTGAAEVTLVCHSMGGLAARAHLRECARQNSAHGVAKLVTLGSPHHGTQLARIERSANGRQMVPGSRWLMELAEHERGAWPCPLVSIYSFDDNVVVPQLSSHLAGARNIALSGIGHISLPLSRRVIGLVLVEAGGV